ncbi:hypothetical protein AXF42_Ash005521 [Apostasia shenzhenica]|uniref:Uncharacterized protein n=1 Tax=Apostasia shenzhenica TaxID=1088818 RepID=A0A2I0B758_9ASPA|nr:hypothetical protein AXF42_Ash005521 [Apostasia shenzhenica]
MSLSRKSVALFLLCLLAAAVAGDAAEAVQPPPNRKPQCYCPCMILRCTQLPGVTVDICATACDMFCKKTGLPGTPLHGDKFCGLKGPGGRRRSHP